VKYLLASIAPDMRSRVVPALNACHVPGLTVSDALSLGRGIDGGAIRYPGVDRPLVDGSICLTAVIHDASPLRWLAGFHKAGNCQSRQPSNNCDHYLYFNQGKTLVIPFESMASHPWHNYAFPP
jgi:hypothetical protein